MKSARLLLALSGVASLSCASPAAPTLHAWIEGDHLIIESGEHVVPAGEETFECFYTDLITDREIAVSMNDVLGFQGEGGHHLTAYWTAVHRESGHAVCNDAEMVNWHQVAGADGSGTSDERYVVPGLAARIPAGAQIMLQAHYVGLSADHTVHNRIEVLMPRPEDIREYGGNFYMNEESFEVPAHAGLRVVTTCRVASEVRLAFFIGHLHEWGSRFSFERRAASGTFEMLYDHPWEAAFFSHPPVNNYGVDAPLLLHAGDELRTTCEWQNTEDHPLLFPQEMCVAYGQYFPDTGADIECEVFDRVETPL